MKLNPDVPDIKDYFGVLGVNAWTALWGLEETAALRPGETVVISAAAGATGLLACHGRGIRCRWRRTAHG